MAPASATLGRGTAHESKMKIFLCSDLLADVLEGEGLICHFQDFVILPVDLKLTGEKLMVKVNDIDAQFQ